MAWARYRWWVWHGLGIDGGCGMGRVKTVGWAGQGREVRTGRSGSMCCGYSLLAGASI